MRNIETEVRTRVGLGIGIAHAISVGIYLLGAVSITSIIGGLVLQLAFQGPHATSVTPDSTNSATLTWTAPGDDGSVGTATSYDIRYSSDPLSEQAWASATSVANPPTPLVAGSHQEFTVTGLTAGTLYYFGIKSTDGAGNQSSISNVPSKRTDALACTPQWSCTDWSVCSNGTQTKACIDTHVPVCGTNFNRPIETQTCTTPEPPPVTCTPRWSCSDWTACSNGSKARVCEDVNVCGSSAGKPDTTYDCSAGGPLPDTPSASFLVSVPAKGGEPRVKVYTSVGKKTSEFLAFPKSFRGGLSVAGGDITGDGQGEILVGTGVGSAPQVSMFSRTGRLLSRFFPFSSQWRTGVNVAVGDVDGDGNADLVTVPAGNYPALVRVFHYDQRRKQFVRLADISTQGGRFRSGVNIEIGDLDRNGLSDIVVTPAAAGRGSTVEVYEYNVTSGRFGRVSSFSAYAKGFQSGITTAIGDVDGDGNNELMTAPAPGVTDVRVFTYSNHRAVKMGSFLAGSTSFRGGVDLTALDVNRDGRDDIVTVSYSNGLPGIRVFTKSITSTKFNRITSPFPSYVYSTTFQQGVRLGAF